MRRITPILSTAGLAVLLVIAGCNVLDTAYEEGGTVDQSIEDAQHARANGDFDTAERLLRDALDQEPGHPVVRLELSSTLLQRQQINIVNLERVTTYVLDEIEAAGGGARHSASSDTCTFDLGEPTRPFDPNAVEDYAEIADAAPILSEVLGLLNDVPTPSGFPVIPAGLGEIDPCTVVQDGTLAYDRDALLDALREQFDGDDRRVNAALKMNAIALTLGAYVNLFENENFPVAWYLVGEEDDVRVGFCMDRDHVDSFHGRIDTNLDALAEAFFSLDLLIYNVGDEEMRQLVDEAVELYETFEESFGRYCGD